MTSKKKKKREPLRRVLLLDGDVLVYRIGLAHEMTVDWGDSGTVTRSCNLPGACLAMDVEIAGIKERLAADEVIVALTCHDTANFRKAIFPTYKANRASVQKPVGWKGLRDHLLAEHAAKVKDSLEADDVIGILATNTWNTPAERIIVSVDKDFRTIPGKLFLLGKSTTPEVISQEEADRFFYTQVLTGDRVDNYPGVPGVGPKKAEAILAECSTPSEYWTAIVKAYERASLTEADALVQARCARILTVDLYDFKNKQPKLWEAPCLSQTAESQKRSQPTSSATV